MTRAEQEKPREMQAPANSYQIILLPNEDYWSWVAGVRDYAVHYRASVTARPEHAVRFHRPQQVITVVDAPGAHNGYANLVEWMRREAPEVPLDVIRAGNPGELHHLLAERVRAGARFGDSAPSLSPAELPLRLSWPTDYPIIIQAFGASPEIYRRWSLPGHEGVDFRAPLNSGVYACADGVVYMVHDGTADHAYGIHVRVRHTGGYKTVYAHLNEALVHTGQAVKAGDLIGRAGCTGNSARSHLHLVLKRDGASKAGLTAYPGDIIDPTPFLAEKPEKAAAAPQADWWPYDQCLVGLRARLGGPMEEADWAVVREARVGALKFDSTAASGDVARARAINPEMLIVVQLKASAASNLVSARKFARDVREGLASFYEQGVRLFEVHDAPNLSVQGYGRYWRGGAEFAQWFMDVVALLRGEFPEARFGWPGLSAGPTTSGVRLDHRVFLESAGEAVALADWIGCHCHWQTQQELDDTASGRVYTLYREEWPGRLLLITEFSNPSPDVTAKTKAAQYAQFVRDVRSRGDIGAAFGFVVSAAHNYPFERWRSEAGEMSPIVEAVRDATAGG